MPAQHAGRDLSRPKRGKLIDLKQENQKKFIHHWETIEKTTKIKYEVSINILPTFNKSRLNK